MDHALEMTHIVFVAAAFFKSSGVVWKFESVFKREKGDRGASSSDADNCDLNAISHFCDENGLYILRLQKQTSKMKSNVK